MFWRGVLICLLAAVLASAADGTPGQRQANVPACYRSTSPSVALTSYWIAVEGTLDDSGLLDGPATVPLKECLTNRTIELVANETFRKCQLEGTCRLKNGLTINLGNSTDPATDPCFVVLGANAPYGLGSQMNPLVPWVSVASNDLAYGTILFVPRMDGFIVPGATRNRTHNGCVRVDDIGWSFGGCHIDWFVATYGNYINFTSRFPTNIVASVRNASTCPILDYVGFTPATLAPQLSVGSQPTAPGRWTVVAVLLAYFLHWS